MQPHLSTVCVVLALSALACTTSSVQVPPGHDGGASDGGGGAPGCHEPPTPANPLDAEETSFVAGLNTYRKKASAPPIAVCASLNVSASAHSDDMRDHSYLAEISPIDMSNAHTRACKAGYAPACGASTSTMSELVAVSVGTGQALLMQFTSDPSASHLLAETSFVVVGLGRSIGCDNDYWTIDLASMSDPSCN
jgi:uncharacterized protein YkwD